MNPHKRKAYKILSLARLPIPPLAPGDFDREPYCWLQRSYQRYSVLYCTYKSEWASYLPVLIIMDSFDAFDPPTTAVRPPSPPEVSSLSKDSDQAAVNMIRQKIAQAYNDEPSAEDELATATHTYHPSKHQAYMQQLHQSGLPPADLQAAWHAYYADLPDNEKYAVWQDFYAAAPKTASQPTLGDKPLQRSEVSQPAVSTAINHELPVAAPGQLSGRQPDLTGRQVAAPQPLSNPFLNSATAKNHRSHHAPAASVIVRQALQPSQATPPSKDAPTVSTFQTKTKALDRKQLRSRIRRTITANGKLKPKHHLQSLLFGLGMGAIVLVIMLFSFFNQMVIAPFIQPSRKVSNQPIIVGASAVAGAQPTVIVPKINIQIPVDFTLQSNDEATIQNSLENGVVHYPSTVLPGQNGNSAYFGHSSQNIFNNGKYKFAFVLLHQVTTGDLFYVTHDGKVYVYQVFAKEIVPPTQVSVLTDTKGKPATAVLITCDPPGLSTNRLVVWGEQISPSPTSNGTPRPVPINHPRTITDNGPSLWKRITDAVTFWN